MQESQQDWEDLDEFVAKMKRIIQQAFVQQVYIGPNKQWLNDHGFASG
ncbi:hypothetical protein [Thermosporothrix hazakensis]|nr:hypothetical protein [Thermosporothrix hazakensis]